jgi:[protein-PII] uridylyltransferase
MTAELYSGATFAQDLGSLIGGGPINVLDIRTKASGAIRNALTLGKERAEKQLITDGNGTACATALAALEDMIISQLFDFARARVFTDGKNVAGVMSIVAVGGYGRGTLAPGSDIDLLFLVPSVPDDRVNRIVEFVLYALWDARQKVGHATRNIEECLKLSRTDNTITTSILEARYICGSRKLFDQLYQDFRSNIVKRNARKFVTDKLNERDQRQAKFGESRYAVEPDIKEGKGGLRDLHTLFWIAKFLFDANSPEELGEKGVFSKQELYTFQKCEDFLLTVRCHLHFISKRGEDKISFDRQNELAERLGYKGHGGLKQVERFMKHYFLIAKDVGDLTRIFCASLEAQHLKDAPVLSRVFGRFLRRTRLAGDSAFSIDSGRVNIADEDAFQSDPVNIIRIFKVASDQNADVHPDALKIIRLSLRRIDENLRGNQEANELILGLLTASRDPETLLRMMNEAGVLGRFMPDFGRIVAMMQFNMYHHYTVDEHLIRTVGVLHGIESGQLSGDHPLSVALFPTLTSRRALYVAALLHDIAKGRPEDHSVAGERIALELCPKLGMSPAETETVAWLIRHHLLMSETAQMRDLNDFKTILDFTGTVQSLERLKLLLILTVCDIRAVGPGVWNGWKGQLLRTLYTESEPVLTGGHTAVSRKERVAEAQARYFDHHQNWTAERKKLEAARHYDAYWLNVSLERQLQHEKLIARAAPRDVTTDVKTDAFAAITEITVYAPDHPRLLAMLFGACTAANANIVGAQIFTTTDGMALDTILLQRELQDEADERRRAELVCETIKRTLQGRIRLRDALANAQRPMGRAKAFTVEPRVIIDNSQSNKYTLIEINGLDRLGLLHGLTEALFHLNLNIASAHITTFGEKAVDVFYVTDLTGAKVENPARHKQIEKSLMTVLEPQKPEEKISA